ncbi:MAG TPA: 50S ribosomal protein L24 [Bacilli bacterium]|nr:50S ribosomal protein L24 [Bacilli bacterium]
MHIKKGDKVIVITGADKGKTGIVQRAYPKLQKVVVEGVNVKKKHRKPTQNNPEGSILEVYAPIHVSNVALIDPKTKKPTRVGVRIEKGQKVRYAKKSGETIK